MRQSDSDSPQPESKGAATKARLLQAAHIRFARDGYADTSLATLAADLGTTKAAIYYHFASKADVLDALLQPSLATLTHLAEIADAGVEPVELLAQYIDALLGSCRVILDLQGDRSVLREHGARHNVGELNRRIVTALARGGEPIDVIRAQAALGAARAGVLAATAHPGGPEQLAAARAQILESSRAALGTD